MVEVSENTFCFRMSVELSGKLVASLSQQSTTIRTLPDDVLLEMFKYHLDKYRHVRWYLLSTLAQVCQRWRHIIYASPRYLDLQIICTTRRPPRYLMGGWPALPITILHTASGDSDSDPELTYESEEVEDVDNITAVLEHNNHRVFVLKLSDVPSWQLERFLAAMQKPFPELTSLDIGAADKFSYSHCRTPPPVFPDSFLGGSAPCLRSLRLDGIPFPGLPKLLSSSHGLVDIHLWDIPSSAYISPEELATYLSSMKHLGSLSIKPDATDSSSETGQYHPPSSSFTRIVLPALTSL